MRRSWWLPVTAALLSGLTFLLVKDSLTDDAYITLAYAKNLALHGEWALIPGYPANTATSPLNVGLIGLIAFLTRVSGSVHPVLALGVVNMFAAAVFGWGWARLRLPAVGVALVLLNPLLLSAVGLEVLLVPAVLTLLVVFATERRPYAFGLAAGLTILTRLDLIVFVVLIGVTLGRGWFRAIGPALLVALPWHVFSWFVFGSAVPDTLVIKQLQRSFGGEGYFKTGFALMWGQDLKTVLTFLPAELGLLALLGWLASGRFGPFGALGVGGIAYYAVYSVLGVPPYHWYYVPPLVALTMAGTAIVTRWLEGVKKPAARVPALVLVPLLVVGYLPGFVGRGIPWAYPPYFGNWASATDYARVGRELAARVGTSAVGGPGEIGTLAYYCDCTIVDGFSDRGLLGPQIDQRIDHADPVVAAVLRANYARFDRSLRPIEVTYQLSFTAGPGDWTVYSAAKGVQHLTLTRVG